MRCPFCGEKVNAGAVVCKTCRRDFGPFKHLMEKNRELQAKVEMLEAEIADLKTLVEVRGRTFDFFDNPKSALAGIVAYVLLPIAMIAGVHFLLIVIVDANLLFLRLSTAIVTLLSGFTLEMRRRPHLLATACIAVAVAIAAILSMSITMHLVDGSTVLPRNRFERMEMGEYMASITLAYLLGTLIALAIRPLRLPKEGGGSESLETLAAFLAHNLPARARQRFDLTADRWLRMMRIALSILMFLGMVWTGFRRFY